ncbi:MAG TPA: sodium:pantothenate symporter [Planctomycetaceae bacterium]|nr:sodium:pantothenate symporter [Planctomycetaceae bacterium]|tara:strand:- start:319 stop:1890 length:1572 start_codon:yes stop_codon:yes gene_type:complete
MSLFAWSWIFLVIYIAGMVGFGFVAKRRIRSADDFATARRSYGPLFLALAYAATTASGAAFLGFPAIVYEHGLASLWAAVLYPGGIYFGVLVSMRLISNAGNSWGSRSIPEYLGNRFQSDGIRILVSIASLLLFFYLAGQLLSGLVIFEMMLGISAFWALAVTSVVLLIYVSLGGAHADILTDGVQGFLMVIVAVVVVVIFVTGAGLDGGRDTLVSRLTELDPNLVGPLNKDSHLFHSWWSIAAQFIAHIPIGFLPHIGSKLWALKDDSQRKRFFMFAAMFAFTLAMLGLGGASARAVLGDALFEPGSNPNQALPALFIRLFPTWLAAFVGVGVLAAVMSTADGLVVSSAQILSNDLYRRTFAPRFRQDLSEEELDRRVLVLSRWSTAGILVICAMMAWLLMDRNVALLIWAGNGGLMAAFAGPLVLGSVWKGVTRAGAYAGLLSGLLSFIVLHTGLVPAHWFDGTFLFGVANWLQKEAPNPFSCAAIGEILSVLITWLVSLVTRPLSEEHIAELFPAPPDPA